MNYGKRGTRKQIKAVNSTAKKLKTKALINILKACLLYTSGQAEAESKRHFFLVIHSVSFHCAVTIASTSYTK